MKFAVSSFIISGSVSRYIKWWSHGITTLLKMYWISIFMSPIPDHELVPPGKGHYITLIFRKPAQCLEQNRCSTVLELGGIPFYLLGIWCPYLSNDLLINYRAGFVQDPGASGSFCIQDDDDDGEWTLTVPGVCFKFNSVNYHNNSMGQNFIIIPREVKWLSLQLQS